MIHASVLLGVLLVGWLAGIALPWWAWALWLASLVLLGDAYLAAARDRADARRDAATESCLRRGGHERHFPPFAASECPGQGCACECHVRPGQALDRPA